MLDMSEVVAAIRREVPAVMAIYLFGSRATGTATSASDYDVALLAGEPLEATARWQLQERLASLLHADVDLVDLRAASTVMRVQVLATGQVIHEGDPVARAFFEATALAQYARLNEERRGILEDVRARGTIHG